MYTNLKIFTALTPLLFASMVSVAQANPLTAQEFAEKAAMSSQFEISASQMAVEKSDNTAVQKFAQQMIADHTQASNTLKATLPASTVNPGALSNTLDKTHQDKLDTLRQASKEDFDEDYIEIQESAHNDAIAMFADYEKNGKDAALQRFAANTLPVLKSHKDHIESVEKTIDD